MRASVVLGASAVPEFSAGWGSNGSISIDVPGPGVVEVTANIAYVLGTTSAFGPQFPDFRLVGPGGPSPISEVSRYSDNGSVGASHPPGPRLHNMRWQFPVSSAGLQTFTLESLFLGFSPNGLSVDAAQLVAVFHP